MYIAALLDIFILMWQAVLSTLRRAIKIAVYHQLLLLAFLTGYWVKALADINILVYMVQLFAHWILNMLIKYLPFSV